MPARIHAFRCLADNLGALLHDDATGATAAIDVCDAAAYERALAETGWTLTDILITHEHGDHVQGIPALKEKHGARVVGSAIAAGGAPVDLVVADGDTVKVGALDARVHATPGHAPGHLTFHIPAAKAAFVGDVAFVMGCGRVFAEAYEAMWRSLGIVAALPDDTTLYTGHDYTVANARFALHVDPDNAALKTRLAEAEKRAGKQDFFAVTTLAEEKATNPFLRAGEPALAKSAGLPGAPAGEVFRKLREMKNSFKG